MKEEEQILIKDLRNKLKEVIKKELEQLPEQLKELAPKDRLTIVCRLMPFVFPKVETVNLKEGEPFTFDY